jgi:uncharacterized membrane protein AbrB (regulator of aidB expression)
MIARTRPLTLLAGVGAWAAVRLRVPAGGLLLPLFAGVVLKDTGLLAIELPWWLLAACHALVGWSVGLRFIAVAFCGPALARFVARRVPARELLSAGSTAAAAGPYSGR